MKAFIGQWSALQWSIYCLEWSNWSDFPEQLIFKLCICCGGVWVGQSCDALIRKEGLCSNGPPPAPRSVLSEVWLLLGLGCSRISVCFMILSVHCLVVSARTSRFSRWASNSVFSAWPSFSSVNWHRKHSVTGGTRGANSLEGGYPPGCCRC